MDRLGKGQDTVFETVEKGRFFTPTAGEAWDEESVAKLRRAMEQLLPGLLLACLLPNVAGDWPLVAFVGALLTVFGAFRLWDENLWFKLSVLCAGAQMLCLGFQLVGQAMLPALLETAAYPIAGYGATAAGVLVPVLLTVGLWLHHRKGVVWMAVAALAALALPLLKLAVGVPVLIVRIVLAVIGAAALTVLLVRAKAAPVVPE